MENHDRPVPEVERIGNEADEDGRPPRQQAAHDRDAVFARMNDQRGADAGCRRRQWQRGIARKPEYGKEHQRQAGAAEEALQVGRCRGGEEPDAEQGAEQQLPGAEWGQEERKCRVAGVGQHGRGERQQRAGRDQGVQAPRAEPVAGQHEQRADDVELLLDRERPGVQQRLGFRRRVEVTRRQCKKYVRDVGHGGDHAVGELLQLDRQQVKIGQCAGRQQHGEQRRKQPHDAPLVETRDGEAAVLDLVVDQPADQISRDDEENVDADKAAGHEREAGVIGHDRQYSHCPQSVDVRTIFHATHLRRKSTAS